MDANIAQIPALSSEAASKPPKRRRPYTVKKPRPFNRKQLDQRTVAYRMFDNLVTAVIQDAGGESEISAVQRELIETFASIAIRVQDMSARSLAGQQVDLGELSLAASTLTRLASRIGVHRVARNITTLADYLQQQTDQAAE
jgi:hypothetical protein